MRGWSIVGWAAVAVAAMVAAILGFAGTGEPGLRVAIRATARSSMGLFSLAFVASALRRTWPTDATRWLLANRRYVGVSFAVSHVGHLLLILALVGWSWRGLVAEGRLPAVVLGGIGYVFVAAMAATSFDRTAAWLGPRRWTRLHVVGAYYLWTIFFVSTAPRMFGSPLYAGITVGLLSVLVLRIASRTARYSQRGAMAAG